MSRPLFQLGPRLALCAKLVRRGDKVADVGTDHGYLPIWLLKSGWIKSAVALDINPGPLESARHNGKRYGLGREISYRLSDGLEKICPEEADDIVIAGMGGELILRIIEETPWLKDPDKLLVLQPMSSVPELRIGLRELGFQILVEQAVWDAGKVYSAFSASYIGEKPETNSLYPYLGNLQPGAPCVELYAQKVLRELSNQAAGAAHLGEKARGKELQALMDAIVEKYLQPYSANFAE